MRKLTTEQLLAEQARYQAILANGADPGQRRLAETRLREIEEELARRTTQAPTQRHGNRWPHVPILELFREFGATLREKANGKYVGDHPWRHSSKSGTCLVVWPDEGRWFCSSCRTGGDAAALVADYRGCSYADACRWLEARFGPAPVDYETLPWINAAVQDLRVITAEAWEALRRANDPEPFIFRFGGSLIRLDRDEDGVLVPVELTADRLRYVLARCANFYKPRVDDDMEQRVIVRPPGYVIADMLASSDPPVPVLRRIVHAPVFGPDGQLVLAPGYYPATGLYYDPTPGLTIPTVPLHPTSDDVARARSLILDDLFVDFPFVSEADRAHAVALVLLPFVRDLIPGPTPLHLIEAPTEGSGKGLLADVALLPAVGDHVGTMAPGRDAEEWRKSITSVLRAGHPVIWIDNITRPLDSAELAAALTATAWEDRLLGKNEVLRLPVRCIWIATANNPVLSREVARRTIRIRIDPKMDMPWQRVGFKHNPLRAWAREHRSDLIWAALVLVQHWMAHGRPMPAITPLGSFEAWTQVLGGILECAGISGFLGNLDAFYQTAVTDVARWRAFVEGWWATHGSEPVLARDLIDLALDAELDIRGRDMAAQARSLGKQLERMRDRVIGAYRIEQAGTLQRAIRWRLCPRSPSTDPKHTSADEPSHDSVHDRPSDEFSEFSEFCEYSPLNAERVWTTLNAERAGETHDTHKTHITHTTGSLGTPEPGSPPYRLLQDPGAVAALLPELLRAPVLGLDTETTGLDPHTDRVRLVQLAVPDGPVYLVDCFAVDPRVLQPLFDAAETPVLVGHNLAFDLAFLLQAGLQLPPRRWLVDTGLAAQLLDAAPMMPALTDLVATFLGVTLDKTHQQADWSGTLTPGMLAYAAWDAAVLIPLYDRLTDALQQAGLERVASIEFRALPAIVWLRLTGAPFDVDAWRAVSDTAYAEQLRLAEELTATAEALLGPNTLFGRAINWDSVPQVLRLLQEAGLDVADTREETLARYREHPLVAGILGYRDAAKRSSTYGLDWLRHVHPLTGRIHSDWRQIGAATGRMASDRPNLQNIPRDPRYRACFRPADGRVLVKADYAQIELRIAAALAGEPRMLAAFARGEDLHTLTASLVLGKRPDAVTKEDRQLAKAVNFGLLYGMGAAAFAAHARTAYGLRLTDDEAKVLRARFFTAYPGLKRWHRSQPDGAVEVRTAAGRRRVVTRFTDKLNSPVQGTGADGLKLALALLWETRQQCPSAAPVLVVHDEIVVECAVDEAETVRAWLVDAMERGMRALVPQVPIVVETMICRDWSGTAIDEATASERRTA
ncbi:MAG: bifunctional 3'-5' exonuclease/DNA polymerase [Thermorudis peleae]|nr:bifunctional 3'-5' exonuclease/DNA polymerase [Thermorudis peleae]